MISQRRHDKGKNRSVAAPPEGVKFILVNRNCQSISNLRVVSQRRKGATIESGELKKRSVAAPPREIYFSK
jgi:hypothetical protein